MNPLVTTHSQLMSADISTITGSETGTETALMSAAEHAAAMEPLLRVPQYTADDNEKKSRLLKGLVALTEHHRTASAPYARIVDALFPDYSRSVTSLADVPWIPVGLFKSHRLQSVADSEIAAILSSSGTTGQTPSRIVLDKDATILQRRALASVMSTILGPGRLPMLILDSQSTTRSRHAMNARAAGVLGMMTFGTAHCFALNDSLEVQVDVIERFLRRFGAEPFLVFGFTFLVWQALVEQLTAGSADLSNAILVHSGGWKKLTERSVSNTVFKARLEEQTGIRRTHDFYGMVEQIGSVFLEAEDGLLYPPDFADVIIRDPRTLEVVPSGSEGVIQVLSLLPRSYPGHSILTEDLGVIIHENARSAPRRGKGFRVLARIPRSELRGCSDVIATAAGT